MYFLTDDPLEAFDLWERKGTKCYLLTTERNKWYEGGFDTPDEKLLRSIFSDDRSVIRVNSIEEFCERVKQDFALYNGNNRGNPQEEVNALHRTEEATDNNESAG